MPQVRGGLDLALEALTSQEFRELGAEHLDRDLASMLQVVCAIHRGHAADSQDTVDAVSVVQRAGQCVQVCIGHADALQHPMAQGDFINKAMPGMGSSIEVALGCIEYTATPSVLASVGTAGPASLAHVHAPRALERGHGAGVSPTRHSLRFMGSESLSAQGL